MVNFKAATKMNTTYTANYALAIWKYMPAVVVFGTIGHVLTITAVNGTSRRATSFTIYLTTLAVADTLVLYTQMFSLWLLYAFGINMKESGPVMHKMNYFLGFLFIHVSSWIVMCLTKKRTICMYFPHNLAFILKVPIMLK